MDGDLTWPKGFCDIGGKTFNWVRKNREEWCDFTLNEMENPTGLFAKWKTYLIKNKSTCQPEEVESKVKSLKRKRGSGVADAVAEEKQKDQKCPG